jgi:hypothetical protein
MAIAGLFHVSLQLCSNCTICSGCQLTKLQWQQVAPKVGDPVVHLARFDGYPTFGLSHCVECHFDSVTIHSSPAGTWVCVGVSGLRISRAAVVPKAGRWHTTSVSRAFPSWYRSILTEIYVTPVVIKKLRMETFGQADGVFVLDARSGPIVEHSQFLAIGDDAIVIKTFSGTCLNQSGATYTLGSHTHWSWNSVPRPGDTVRFV